MKLNNKFKLKPGAIILDSTVLDLTIDLQETQNKNVQLWKWNQ